MSESRVRTQSEVNGPRHTLAIDGSQTLNAIDEESMGDITFDDVSLSDEHVIGGVDDGLCIMFDGLDAEGIMVAAIANGIGRYAIERAVDYSCHHQVWGAPIGSHLSSGTGTPPRCVGRNRVRVVGTYELRAGFAGISRESRPK